MENNKYVKLHSLLRMLGALLAIAVIISMFIAKQAVHVPERPQLDYAFPGAFFGETESHSSGNVLAFIGYILVILGGLAGLAFVFIDEMIGKDLTKKLSFVVGGLVVLGGIFIAIFFPVFKAVNNLPDGVYSTGAAPIVFGVLGVLAGAANIAAPILEDKGL